MATQNKFYQHKVSIWNNATGIVTKAVLKTREEAEAFIASEEGDEKSYTAEMDNWPYGVFRQKFDVEARNARMAENSFTY